MANTFRHKHLYIFHKFWDMNGDGVLTWDDFRLLAEKYTKIQRRGKLDKDVLDRWKSILEKWWNELTSHADYNKVNLKDAFLKRRGNGACPFYFNTLKGNKPTGDCVVEFDEWVKFFDSLGKSTTKHSELPDFLKLYLHLFFQCMDANKDGLFCIKDYKKYLSAHEMDTKRAEECFKFMLNEEDAKTENAMTSDRFKDLVYDFWVSHNKDSKGKYVCGTFDSETMEELESKINKKP